MDNLPMEPDKGRLSDGMFAADWEAISIAYNTWNESNHDSDAVDFCRTLLEPYGLWNVQLDEPELNEIRKMYMERC